MRIAILIFALVCAAGWAARAEIQQDVINRDPSGGAAANDGDFIDFGDSDGNFDADKIGPAIEELDNPNEAGPNAPDGKVNWEQLIDVPEGFADGTDNTGGGGALDVEEADGNPSVESVENLQFNQANGFSVVDEGSGQAQVNFTITDALVPDNITASNYCALTGCTYTGAVVLDNLGLTGTASDTNPSCGAGEFNIYADDSDGRWKKCEDGVLTDLDIDTDALSELGDVTITTPADGHILNYSSGDWVNVAPPFLKNTGDLDDGEFCKWNASGGAPDCNVPLTFSGNTQEVATVEGALTPGNCVETDADGNFVDAGAACGTGGGSITVEEADGTPSVTDVTTVQFDQGDGFIVSDEGEGQVEIGLSLGAEQVIYADADNVYTTDTVEAAIEALRDTNESGPNATTGKVNWEQIMNMPELFLSGEISAADVDFDNADTDLAAGDVQMALEELDAEKSPLITVEESDDNPSVTPSTTVQFGATQFTVTDEGAGQVQVDVAAIAAAIVSLADSSGRYTATNVENALKELGDTGGTPNDSNNPVDWGRIKNIPAFRKTLVQLKPQGYEPPTSTFATLGARNAHPTLRFNGNVCAIWSFVMPNWYGGNGVTVDIIYASTETSNDTDWDVSMELIGTSHDVDSDSFATAVSGDNNNNNATSGIPTKVSVALTSGAQMDSCVVDALCRVRVCRDDTGDTGGADTIDYIGGQIRETP